MPFSTDHLGLYTDFYELAMAQGYFYSSKNNDTATFDYYFRTNPFDGGFTVFAGLHDFLTLLTDFRFSQSDISYLKKQGFKSEFLDYLSDFRFNGSILSMREGEVVFPNEPLLRVNGNILECQLIESMLLNILNFESLVATKAFRIKMVAGDRPFTDFGLRRGQGFGALHASRATCIGGAQSTSNVMAGKLFQIPVSGTQAHSWIQSFDSELEAFRAFAAAHPENTILLVDTIDTLKSGIPNAVKVAREMETKGDRLRGIRLDSGDLAYLSKKARKMLDDAGLDYVKIIASNQLNEHVIKSLLKDQDAKIDAFGVGTELITGKKDAALDGVYKLAQVNKTPKMKLSENIEKVTLPGQKLVFRFYDETGKFYRDAIILEGEEAENIQQVYHPVYPEKQTNLSGLKHEKLLHEMVNNGKVTAAYYSPSEIHEFLLTRADKLPEEHKRFISPHIYKVGISGKLLELRNNLKKTLENIN